jgi:hypothetical protein
LHSIGFRGASVFFGGYQSKTAITKFPSGLPQVLFRFSEGLPVPGVHLQILNDTTELPRHTRRTARSEKRFPV